MVETEVLSLTTADKAKLAGVLYKKEGSKPKIGLIIMHPVVDFHRHYAARPLAEAGIWVLGLNSRYTRFEHAVIMERVLLDLGEGVKLLRERGCTAVALVGNSGGGPLVAFYQAQAENPTITETPDGRPCDLTRADLPPADAVIELNGHRGRHHFLTLHLDPSVVDESDMFSRDSALDMYDRANGPPYDPEWLKRYRAAQIARSERITAWADAKVRDLNEWGESLNVSQGEVLGQQIGVDAVDLPFVVHRTMADPRTLDLTIEPNDRQPGTVWGPPHPLNWSVTALGRISTARSWLSQYSWSRSNAGGPENLKNTSVPLLVLVGTADQGCYFGDANAYIAASTVADKTLHRIEGGTHFMRDQPDKVAEVVDTIAGWLNQRFA
jgi:fermentation-respiration switch protein FrsA (DUF1100 family)